MIDQEERTKARTTAQTAAGGWVLFYLVMGLLKVTSGKTASLLALGAMVFVFIHDFEKDSLRTIFKRSVLALACTFGPAIIFGSLRLFGALTIWSYLVYIAGLVKIFMLMRSSRIFSKLDPSEPDATSEN